MNDNTGYFMFVITREICLMSCLCACPNFNDDKQYNVILKFV